MDIILGLIGIIIILIIAALLLAFLLKDKLKGGSGYTTMMGSTYEFYGKEKQKAIETVTEIQADKKMEEQSSDQPKENDSNETK